MIGFHKGMGVGLETAGQMHGRECGLWAAPAKKWLAMDRSPCGFLTVLPSDIRADIRAEGYFAP